MHRSLHLALFTLSLGTAACLPLFAQTIMLQQPTATFSQGLPGDFSIARAIDGVTNDDMGWAISPNVATAQTGVFEAVANVNVASGNVLTFNITQNFRDLNHTLGRFRLSATTDDRNDFADGLQSGGDVTANWQILDPATFTTANGTVLTKQGDLSLLASGVNPGTDTYTVTAATNLIGITGFRLEALPDASLPFGGSGREDTNGNFVVSEFEVRIAPVPAPSSLFVALLGVVPGVGLILRRRRIIGS